MSSIEETERFGAEGATAPRVTLKSIEAKIGRAYTFNLGEAMRANGTTVGHRHPSPQPTDRVTVCVLEMANGFVVIGKSAPMDPLNFDPAKAALFAYEDCIRQLWPMEAYSRLSADLAAR